MKLKSKLPRVLLFAFFFVGAPLFFFYWYAPPKEDLPIDAFLPQTMSAGLRLDHFQQAWALHWKSRAQHIPPGRPNPTPDDAVQALMDADEQWPVWVKKYGEMRARLQLDLFQSTLFQALGEDAWLVFGEWDRNASGALAGHVPLSDAQGSTVGLVILLRGSGPMLKRIQPLLSFAFGDTKLETTSHAGVQIYEFKDRRLGHSISFCQVGGWIVGSWRLRGTGPLPLIIDQARRMGRGFLLGSEPKRDPQFAALFDAAGTTPSAVRMLLRPDLLWGQYRQLQMQRGHSVSDAAENSLKAWQQRLQGVDEVTIVQSGQSLFNWDLALTGPGPRRWTEQLLQEAHSTTSLGLGAPKTTATLANLNIFSNGPATQRPPLLQLDLDLAFARMALPLAGYAWEDALEPAKALDLITPGLREQLTQRLTAWSQPADGRLGLAAYAGDAPLFPDVLGWIDLPPQRPETTNPAELWRGLDGNRRALDPSDQLFWIRKPPAGPLPSAGPAPAPKPNPAWPPFVQAHWQGGAAGHPQGFMAADFTELASAMEAVPEKKFKKEGRKELRRWRRITESMELAFGGATLRVDATPDAWHATLRTL